jgi:plasmid stability protein
MAQLTVRTTDELVDRVRAAANRLGRSMNEYVVAVLGAATDPDLAGDDAERIRERLARAGLLASTGETRRRPDADAVAEARAAAGRGTPLSDIVTSDRT